MLYSVMLGEVKQTEIIAMRPFSADQFRDFIRQHIPAFQEFGERRLAGATTQAAGTEMLANHPAVRHSLIALGSGITLAEAAALPPTTQMTYAQLAFFGGTILVNNWVSEAIWKEDLLPHLGANGRTVQ